MTIQINIRNKRNSQRLLSDIPGAYTPFRHRQLLKYFNGHIPDCGFLDVVDSDLTDDSSTVFWYRHMNTGIKYSVRYTSKEAQNVQI